MKKYTKVLSMLLALCMVIGMMPIGVLAASETVLDAAIFCSDVHGSTSDLTSVLGGVAKSGVDYSSIGFVGDTCLTVANTTSTVQSALGDTNIAVMFSYASSHDTEDGADIDEKWDYSGEVEGVSDYYLVYTIRETDMENSSDAATAAPAFTTWYSGLTEAEKALPIFIMSHRPLHDRRDDNAGAATWYSAISAAAESSDIVFFWAHNHTGETSVDTNAYYVAKDGDETFTVYNGDTVKPNFTYMNAGYINANNQNPKRINVATTVQITADSLIFQDYTTSGTYTDSSYSHNVTVEREFAADEVTVTLSSIALSGTTEYSVGDELALTVTATYSDGSTANVTTDAELTGYDMDTAGTYTVTATYGEKTATIDITVKAVQINSITVAILPDKTTYATGEELDTTGMVVMGNYSNGTTAEVTGWYTSAVDMTTAGEKEVTVNYAVDGITYKTTFTITVEQGVAEGVTLSSIEITEEPDKTEYLISQELDLDGMVVVATFSDGSTVKLEYEPFATSTIYGGYELDNFSMYVEKNHEMKVTYTFGEVTCTDTTTINVWNEDFEDETGVSVHVTGDYGVTDVTVDESANEYVADAIGEFIKAGTYVAYDIDLVFDEGYETTNAVKTVTLPVPDGVSNPVVYYVSDDGETVTNMYATKSGSYVTFDTTHFSTYVVGESTEITVPESQTATGSNTTTTTTTKTVYVLSSGNPSGNVLIANSATADSVNLVANDGGDLSNTTSTVIYGDCDGDGDSEYYIELDDATDELWTVSDRYSFENQDEYLRCNDGDLSVSGRSTTWSYSNNRLSYRGKDNTYYLRYDNGWTVTRTSSSASSIYFYVPTKVEVKTTTTVSGTYSIAGEDIETVVEKGTTAELSSTLTFTPESGSVTTKNVSTAATYEIVTVDANGNTVDGDPNNIIDTIEDGVVTFTGNCGKALVKVSYTTDFGIVTDYITITAKAPTYTVEITKDNAVVTDIIPVKGVTNTTTLQLGTNVTYETADGTESITPTEGSIEWSIPAEYKSIATIDENGLITFKGKSGTFYVTVTYTTPNGVEVTDTITINATRSEYNVPEDGTNDFPEYPNEGAIRFDKTATAVGNFSETGIAQVELSLTGVPYTTGSEIDVVLMLDITGSMHDKTSSTYTYSQYVRVEATIIAAKEFVKSIVINEDGSYNSNRVGVYSFNSNGTYTLIDLGTISSDAELEAAYAAIEGFDDDYASGGTPYDDGLSKVQSTLATAKTDGTGNNRQQFAVFMTDGVPTDYEYITGTTHANYDSASDIAGMITSSSSSESLYDKRDSDYKYEYYSTEMKDDGVTVYTVGIGLENKNSAWSGSATQCLNLASVLLNDISGPANESSQPDAVGTSTLSKKDSYFFSVDDADAATEMENVFSNIAQQILQAATDVVVEDKISDDYTMIFDIPTGSNEITDVSDDFYIEFVEYTLDSNHERTGDPTTLTKLYLGVSNGEYYAASDNSGTAYAAPVFEQKTLGDKGTLYFWTTDASKSDSGISYTSGDTTYYFVPYGMKATDSSFVAGQWFNMTSGAYASGSINSATNMSEDLLIVTPYFVYDAATRMLYWTVDKLTTTEYALRYFLYLQNSATEVGTPNETEAGSYVTNDYAYLTYTNFNGEDCRQRFPVPQQTWSGAQVSYVFYLVDETGTPINMAGQTVDFANATFVTNVYTESVVWNKGEDGKITADSVLSADWLASELLPDVYTIYDEQAGYELKVYGSHDGTSIFDYFTIEGGTAADISASLNTRLELETTAGSVSTGTTKVYNTKAGTKYSAYGTYTSEATDSITDETILNDFDFYNTTVAFAVVWSEHCVDDSVVIDYGLPVDISVLANDMLDSDVTLTGVSKTEAGSYATSANLTYGSAAVSGSKVRYTPTSMTMSTYDTFWYQVSDPVNNGSTAYFCGKVTVIPATTIYYEEGFTTINFANSSAAVDTNNDGEVTAEDTGNGIWRVDGEAYAESGAIQNEDRPGQFSLSTMDANNLYGFDSNYTGFTQYSLDGAMKVTVDAATAQLGGAATPPTASFTFMGTGFDVISLTDSDSGTIIVEVTDAAGNTYCNQAVDNYYGYTYKYFATVYTYTEEGTWASVESEIAQSAMGESGTKPESPAVGDTYTVYSERWVVTPNDDTVWQVPVLKVEGLTYGTYNVAIKVVYHSALDHVDGNPAEYSFWLDAIRIYDPANDGTEDEDSVIEDAYDDDNELNPDYITLRDLLVDAGSLTADTTVGVVFIDGKSDTSSITDYANPGPNNETYLSGSQAVSFKLVANAKPASVQIGAKLAMGNSATLLLNGGNYLTVNTATDMYYELPVVWNENNGKYESNVIVLSNGLAADNDTDIISVTNLKAVEATWVLSNDLAPASEDGDTSGSTGYGLRSASVAETSEESEVTEEEVTSEVIEVQETGMGFRMKLSGVRGNKLAKYEAQNNRGAGDEAATEAAAYGLMTAAETEVTPVAAEITAVVDAEVVESALAVMNELNNAGSEEVVEPFVPEHFESVWERSRNGRKATLTVTTSEDVEYISINGKIFTEYETKTVRVKTEDSSTGGFFGFINNLRGKGYEKVTYRVWTVSYKSNSRETLEAEVIAYNAEDLASEAMIAVDEVKTSDRNNGRR